MLTLLLSHLLTQAKIFFYVKGNHCFNCNVFDVASRFLKCNSFSFFGIYAMASSECARAALGDDMCVSGGRDTEEHAYFCVRFCCAMPRRDPFVHERYVNRVCLIFGTGYSRQSRLNYKFVINKYEAFPNSKVWF